MKDQVEGRVSGSSSWLSSLLATLSVAFSRSAMYSNTQTSACPSSETTPTHSLPDGPCYLDADDVFRIPPIYGHGRLSRGQLCRIGQGWLGVRDPAGQRHRGMACLRARGRRVIAVGMSPLAGSLAGVLDHQPYDEPVMRNRVCDRHRQYAGSAPGMLADRTLAERPDHL